jgi:hypothetical protein
MSDNTFQPAWIEGVKSASKHTPAFFNLRMQRGLSTHNTAPVVKRAACATLRLAGSPETHANAHWIADSGATSHMSTQHHWFKMLKPHIVPICIASNAIVYSEGIGLIVMEPTDKSLGLLLISSVLYVPALQNNLLSVLHLVSNHCFRVEIEGTDMFFLRNGQPMFTATICNNTAWLDIHTRLKLRRAPCEANQSWTARFGTVNWDTLAKMPWSAPYVASWPTACSSTATRRCRFTVSPALWASITAIPFLQKPCIV